MDFGRAIGHGRDGKPFVLDLPSCGTRVQTGRPEYHPGYFGVFVRDRTATTSKRSITRRERRVAVTVRVRLPLIAVVGS
jgi:hypothetical protein